jgi:SAM-dependent methyltransferase
MVVRTLRRFVERRDDESKRKLAEPMSLEPRRATYDIDQIRSDFERIAALPEVGPDHNALYHRYLLRHVPQTCERALDAGCGTGSFARLLADRASHVDGLDLAPGMIAAARRQFGGGANIHFEVADFMERPLGQGVYDVIASVATLHHLPLVPALTRLADALRPGGTLLVLDLLDPRGLRELPRNALAWLVARAHALATRGPRTPRAVRQAWDEHGRRDRYDSWPSIVGTYDALLPGTRLRHHLLWRYSAIWRKALTPPAPPAFSSTSATADALRGAPR